MDALQQSIEDLKTLMEKMNTTVSALEPLVPSVASLVALPTSVESLQQTMKEAGDHLKSVTVAVKRLEVGDRSSGSSDTQKSAEDDGVLGPRPRHPPPPPFPRPPPVQARYGAPRVDLVEDEQSILKPKMVFPSYDGTGDPLPWINRCDLYFRGHNTPEHRKVWMASLHTTDAAQLWYYRLETAQGEPGAAFVNWYIADLGRPSQSHL